MLPSGQARAQRACVLPEGPGGVWQFWPWASWCGVRSSSTEEAEGHLGPVLIEELIAQGECGMFLKLRTRSGYHEHTPPSPVPCPEVFTGHCICVSSPLPPPSTSSFKIIWWFCRSFFQKKCIIFICKIVTKCKIPRGAESF